ncbi:MAG TPA: UDP-N-acetylmuramate dehydrogenase [Polyangiaceae bacterium]|nr:UDP-N-acetylmuramate dehydrogenase [Polyangiaceae bacterium]
MTRTFAPARQVPLAGATSLRLGGPAQFHARLDPASSPGALAEALDWAAQRSLPVTILGGGSNVVIADAGLSGLVLTIAGGSESIEREGDSVRITIGAGAPWDDFVARCVARGWSGIECLSGIPGHVGATPIQNVGAYGQEVADTIVSLRAHDRASGQLVELTHGECAFGYRTSRFKTGDTERFIVLDVTFRLQSGGAPCRAYPELARRLPPEATLVETRRIVLDTRREKSMLLDPNDENGRSCGSFFLNPLIEPTALDDLRARAAASPPTYPQPDGRLKLPAAWLIERAGFHKGQRWGAVGISTRHSLALVAHEGATSHQILEAAHRIRDGVHDALGIELTPEPLFLGFGSSPHGLPRL